MEGTALWTDLCTSCLPTSDEKCYMYSIVEITTVKVLQVEGAVVNVIVAVEFIVVGTFCR